jgi:hypothetical protein
METCFILTYLSSIFHAALVGAGSLWPNLLSHEHIGETCVCVSSQWLNTKPCISRKTISKEGGGSPRQLDNNLKNIG